MIELEKKEDTQMIELEKKISQMLRDPYEFRRAVVTEYSERGRPSSITPMPQADELIFLRIWNGNSLVRHLLQGNRDLFLNFCRGRCFDEAA